MRRRIIIRGDQREELELKRLAHALLRAAREAAKAEQSKPTEKREARHE